MFKVGDRVRIKSTSSIGVLLCSTFIGRIGTVIELSDTVAGVVCCVEYDSRYQINLFKNDFEKAEE